MIIVLTGVAGSGKTTVGEMLADRLRFPFLDADELHTVETVERMKRGEPLTAGERTAWVNRVLATVRGRDPLVLACSALRRQDRDKLRALGDVRMFALEVPRSELERRLRHRPAHFFAVGLLENQLETLEPPIEGEEIVVVDADRVPAAVVDAIVANLGGE
jgi:gluconokinase